MQVVKDAIEILRKFENIGGIARREISLLEEYERFKNCFYTL